MKAIDKMKPNLNLIVLGDREMERVKISAIRVKVQLRKSSLHRVMLNP